MKSGSRRKQKETRTGKLCVAVMVVMLLAVMSSQIVKLYAKEQEYMRREEALTQQLEAETEREAQLKDYEAYTKTDEFVEDVARSKLGLVYDNEIVFKEDKEAD